MRLVKKQIRPLAAGAADVSYKRASSILTKTSGFLFAYDYSLNPYSGCSFGCTYCYAAFFSRDRRLRESWGYWVQVKENAVDLLRRKRRGTLDGKSIYMSSVTDPYQPVERQLRLTRRLLEMFVERGDQVKLVVQTRGPDVVRDIDCYKCIEENGGKVQINLSITTDDEEIRSSFEPYCPSNQVRLKTVKRLVAEGLQTCITMTPLLWVSDPKTFGDELVATGCTRFILQSFHFERGSFIAQTRDEAMQLMARRVGRDPSDYWQIRYLEEYEYWRAVLRGRLLAEKDVTVGEGVDGFAPPF